MRQIANRVLNCFKDDPNMKTYYLSFVMLLGAAAGITAADAPPAYYPQPEQVGNQDCVTHSCKLVPETKQIKKTVYEVQEVPFCVKRLPPLLSLFHHHGCDDCVVCP